MINKKIEKIQDKLINQFQINKKILKFKIYKRI